MNAIWIISGLSKACDSHFAVAVVVEVINTLLSRGG